LEKSPISETAGSVLAVFDFDHTLITGDSFWPFLAAVVGWPRTLAALAEGLVLLALAYARNANDPQAKDYRTFIKAHLLQRLLVGKSVGALPSAIAKTYKSQTWNEPMRKALSDHHAHGHRILIISGALDLYLPDLVKTLPQHDIVCTRVEVKDGVITGNMVSGNCVRHRKAELLGEWITVHGPFADSWGYGNYPHDIPMLGLLKHRIIV
jgi:phosphatidylglycerophosphatase C